MNCVNCTQGRIKTQLGLMLQQWRRVDLAKDWDTLCRPISLNFPSLTPSSPSFFLSFPSLSPSLLPLIILIGSRVVSVLDSGTEGPGFKLQPRRCRVTVLSKQFTPIVPLFTKQQVYDSLHLQADCQEPVSAPEAYTR